jgi:nucleoside-diphosphate-sugar epimerase
LVARLRGDGLRVRALVRSTERAADHRVVGVELVGGDIGEADAVAAATDGVAVVFHLAGRLFDPAEEPEVYRTTHVDGTQLLLDHARTQARLVRFVHCSTTGVLGRTGPSPADEDAPFSPTNLYEASKALAELRVRAACREGLPGVMVRPGLVYGPGDLHLVSFFRAVLRRRFRPIGREAVWLHPIYIDDMTEAFVRCVTSAAAVGECFHIAGPELVSLEQLAATIAVAEGTPPASGRIPLAAARVVAAFGDALPPRLRQSAPLTRSRLDFLTHSRVYDVGHAERRLGFAAPTRLDEGVARTVAWYRDHGYLPPAACTVVGSAEPSGSRESAGMVASP